MENNPAPTTLPSLLSSPVGIVLKPDVIILESSANVGEAIKLMTDKNSRSVLVSNRGEIIGVVSKTDILFRVISQNRSPDKVKLREVMTCPVLAVRPNSTVSEALSVMDKHKVRQVFVHAYAAVLGMVTRDDIYQLIETISVSSQETAMSGTPVCIIDSKSISYIKDNTKARFLCPYCESPFDTKEGLSKHMDRIHQGGVGVLEGDIRQMFE
ncbi:MAG TPA: CBS domain-containing protein [Nitrososphaeraceae archaeon]|nr:CBS domain-containing protein [Nitrososphaeraceae archaeon]